LLQPFVLRDRAALRRAPHIRHTGKPLTHLATLVVLPGMDGTGEMLAEFAREARAHFDAVQVIAYPRDQAMDYAALAQFVRAALPKDAPFVLLGESFSGPLALQIASSPPRGLQGIVLSTSFARDPVPMLRPFAALLARLPVRAVPMRVVAWWLLGRWQTPALRAALRQALGSLAPEVLPARMRCALRANEDVQHDPDFRSCTCAPPKTD
jgi:pimeloyl-ACP methyl ester carboxylesterase